MRSWPRFSVKACQQHSAIGLCDCDEGSTHAHKSNIVRPTFKINIQNASFSEFCLAGQIFSLASRGSWGPRGSEAAVY